MTTRSVVEFDEVSVTAVVTLVAGLWLEELRFPLEVVLESTKGVCGEFPVVEGRGNASELPGIDVESVSGVASVLLLLHSPSGQTPLQLGP